MLSKKALEEIEKVLEEIMQLSAEGAAILVEGKKDVEAMRELGAKGPIHSITSSRRTVLNYLENLPNYEQALILTDFDRTGDELAAFCNKHLKKLGIEPISDLREKLKSYLRKGIKDIESLEKFLYSERKSN